MPTSIESKLTHSQNPVWRTYSATEELVNTLTHGLACPLILILIIRLLFRENKTQFTHRRFWSIVVYGLSSLMVFVTSMLYHGTRKKSLKRIFQTWDHTAIFILIAGSYTPFCLIPLWQSCGIYLFSFVWLAAVVGILCKVFFWDWFLTVSLPYFLSLGWSGVIASWSAAQALTWTSISFVIVGGVVYSLGCYFFVNDRPYDHAIWHICVLVGNLAIFFAMCQFL
jgi:hemolysin III